MMADIDRLIAQIDAVIALQDYSVSELKLALKAVNYRKREIMNELRKRELPIYESKTEKVIENGKIKYRKKTDRPA